MSVGQTATSLHDSDKIYKSDYALHWSSEEGDVVELNANVLSDNTWEVDVEWVDFWTAFQAAKKEGWAILSEFDTQRPIVLPTNNYFSQGAIDGRWQILK
jgi:hypothetical protein